MSDTFEQIQSVLSKMLKAPPDQITLETKRADFANWDSLKHLDITMELEALFGISFTLEEMTKLDSVQQILDLIAGKMGGNTGRDSN